MLETNKALKMSAAEGNKLVPLTDELLGKLQKTLLQMLIRFDRICQDYGLTYILVGGSALGAVRHKGFIPWDDDLDIGMPRKDYDRLAKIMEQDFKEEFWVQNIADDTHYDLGFMKIRAVGTKFQEIFDTEPEKSGFFIDIYPIENLPSSKAGRFFYCFREDLLQFFASCVRIRFKQKQIREYVSSDSPTGRTVKIKALFGKILSVRSLYSWVRAADRWASHCSNDESEYVGIPVGRNHSFKEVYLREKMLPGVKTEFEKQMFPIPPDSCYYLKTLYGDFMKIPDVKDRERHSVLAIEFKGESE